MERIKVMVADDQEIVAEGLCALLSVEEDIYLVGTAGNGKEVIELLKEVSADVILMDIRMPEMNGVECTKFVTAQYPNTKVLILTTFDDDDYILEALNNGASGYMLKDLSSDSLLNAVKDVWSGNTVMHQKITQKIVSGISGSRRTRKRLRTASGEVLTPREEEVLKLLASGATNAEIAETLHLSNGTVKNYMTLLYDKLEIKGRTKLMTYVIDSGLLDEK